MELKKLFMKGAVLERAGIPCLIWVGVFTLVLNHLIYPFLSLKIPINTVPLPKCYWDALPWIVGAIMGKKVGDKFITMRDSLEKIDERSAFDADRNKPQTEHGPAADTGGKEPPCPEHS